MKIQSLVIGALIAAAAVPASATTLVATFDTAGNAVASVTRSVPFFSVTVTARSYSNVAPNALTTLGGNSPILRDLTQNNAIGFLGLGIVGGAAEQQMDTNQVARREAFLLTGTQAFFLTNLTLTAVDPDDTLQIYGVRANGNLVSFTYGSGTDTAFSTAARNAGAIASGAGGSITSLTTSSLNGGTASFSTGIGAGPERFMQYLLTTRVGGNVNYLGNPGQGYTLNAFTATVPEPATWAMLVAGFGMVGFASRRRRKVVAA